MDKTEKWICWYSSLLIALMMNSVKLLALRENGIFAHYWHFDFAEWSFQILYNLAFCFLVFYLNLKNKGFLTTYGNQKKYVIYLLYNALIILPSVIVGSIIQRIVFGFKAIPGVIGSGYFIRFTLSAILIGIVIKIILLMREGKKKEVENEQVKNAYIATELELLKEQMNPHFLFNSLSSLSGVIRENPTLAQKYVRELSNVFRYALVRSKINMVFVNEELTMLQSFAQLVNMRLEGAFKLTINVNERFLSYKIPHLSLQPLLENAVKHNAATLANPLKVEIYVLFDHLIISNNLWEIPTPESSNGVGLVNLNERFKIMMQEEIVIEKNDDLFIVKLPIKA
jgi:sensor histidine kinase YesM